MSRPPPAVATRWAFAPPWTQAAAPCGAEDEAVQALQGLLHQDLRRAHHRLALRHYLMLRALGAQPAPAQAADCERLWAHCSARVRAQLETRVAHWARERRAGDPGRFALG